MADDIIYSKDNERVAVRKALLKDTSGAIKEIIPPHGIEAYLIYQYNEETWRFMARQKVRLDPPITRKYHWSGPFTPKKHQKHTSAFMVLNNRAYVCNGMGTGKSHATAWAFDYLRSIGAAKRLLLLAPLTVTKVWIDIFWEHFPHLSVVNLHGMSADKLHARELSGADVLIANHDIARSLPKVRLFEHEPYRGYQTGPLAPDVLVVDEGSMFRNHQTDKWRGLRLIIKSAPYAWWLTATPTPNSPVDAWAQAALMGTHKGLRLTAFREQTMTKVSQFISVPRPDADRYVKAILQPAIRYRPEDCIDLPDLMYQELQTGMTPEQTKAYKALRDQARLEMAEGQVITAVNEAIKAQKLLAISCGAVYDETGGTVKLHAAHKIEVLREIMEESDRPVIVFAPFKNVVAALAEEMEKYTPAVVTGDTSMHDRSDLIDDFQGGKIRLLIAHPGTMSHGLTLTASSTIVWFAPVYSNDVYTQANGRIYREGQRHKCMIYNLSSSPVEKVIYERLKNRQKVQGTVLEALARV